MKEGDIVYLIKRGMIDWETQDYTLPLQKNQLYIVGEGSTDERLYTNGYVLHPGHFKLYEPEEEGKVKGCNWFVRGDKVKMVLRGKLDWEAEDYTIADGLDEKSVYNVRSCTINNIGQVVIELTNDKGGLHPNHFEKIK